MGDYDSDRRGPERALVCTGIPRVQDIQLVSLGQKVAHLEAALAYHERNARRVRARCTLLRPVHILTVGGMIPKRKVIKEIVV